MRPHRVCVALLILPLLALATVDSAWAVQPFTEEAAQRGVDYTIGSGNAAEGSVAFADLDGDGDPDVVAIGAPDGRLGLWENDGAGNFTDRSPDLQTFAFEKAGGVIAGDYDADGDLDLFISNVLRDDALLRNDGGFTFVDVAFEAGVTGEQGAGGGSAWGDYDGDGWIDLYVSNRYGTLFPDFTQSMTDNKLFRNRGDGTFEDVGEAIGVHDPGSPTLTSAFLDFDHDGDADIYVGNDKGTQCLQEQNVMFRNDGGVFTDVTAETGTQSCTDTMGIAIGDFDGNGWQDLYCTNTAPPPGNALMMNQGGGVCIDLSDAADVSANRLGWGCMFFDHDNDGRLALYVCNSLDPNILYDNPTGFPCPDVAPQFGVDHPGASFNVASADIDADGDLDLLVQDIAGPIRLFVNREGEQRNWTRLKIVGPHPNLDAIGALVKINAGGVSQLREVLAGGNNYRSQNELPLHYGLADAGIIDRIVVTWPGGATRSVFDYDINRTWTIYPDVRLGDADGDADVDADDFAVLRSCYGQPVAPGCEMMDLDGDADIDIEDANLFVARYIGPQSDCNGNGQVDLIDILVGLGIDGDGDGVIDVCEADLDASGSVGSPDLAILLGAWGPCGTSCIADLNGDGAVGSADLAVLLGAWD